MNNLQLIIIKDVSKSCNVRFTIKTTLCVFAAHLLNSDVLHGHYQLSKKG